MYRGFIWSSNFYYANAQAASDYYGLEESGFVNGLLSDDHVAYNMSSVVVSVTAGNENFDFNNVWLTAGFRNGLNISVDGYREGYLKYRRTVVVNWDSPQQFDFNYLDVDSLVFTPWGGEMVDENQDGVPDLGIDATYFVMDDFAYNEVEADYDGLPELNPAVKTFISRNFGKKIKATLLVKNIGNAKADEFKVAMYLYEDGISEDELLDEHRVRRGLKVNRSRNIRLEYSSETSPSRKYLIFVIDSQYEILELDKFNNVKTIEIP